MSNAAPMPRWIFLFDGLLLVLGGLLMLSFPFASTLGIVAWIGAFLLIAGTIGTVRAFRHGDHGPTGLAIVISLACGLIGLFMLLDPPAVAGGLAVVGAIWFLVSGLYQVGGAIFDAALPHRMMTGIIGLIGIVAGVACIGNPATLVWVFGVVFGIQLMFAGFQTIAVGTAIRRLTS
jgi:uncharacterized membrane protein HdeD (DUF308 family)